MNKDEFCGLIRKHGDTQKTLADALGLALSTVNAKINAKNGAEFKQTEIDAIADRYNMTADEIVVVFFPRRVSKKDTPEG